MFYTLLTLYLQKRLLPIHIKYSFNDVPNWNKTEVETIFDIIKITAHDFRIK